MLIATPGGTFMRTIAPWLAALALPALSASCFSSGYDRCGEGFEFKDDNCLTVEAELEESAPDWSRLLWRH